MKRDGEGLTHILKGIQKVLGSLTQELEVQLYKNCCVFFFLFAPISDEPEVFLPKYSQTAILHAPHFRRVVRGDVKINCLQPPYSAANCSQLI